MSCNFYYNSNNSYTVVYQLNNNNTIDYGHCIFRNNSANDSNKKIRNFFFKTAQFFLLKSSDYILKTYRYYGKYITFKKKIRISSLNFYKQKVT